MAWSEPGAWVASRPPTTEVAIGSVPSPIPASAAAFLAGGGEMGARIRGVDWSQTPLGPVGGWPDGLRNAIRLLLGSRFPMLVFWGPELRQLYNDAARTILGETKHPQALGQPARECWAEVWDVVGPGLERAVGAGEATWFEDQLLLFDRRGYAEEMYFTFSQSPIYDDETVGGALVVIEETTRHVLAERRLNMLRELATRAADLRRAEELGPAVGAALGENRADLPFAVLYLVSPDGRVAEAAASVGLPSDSPASPRRVQLDAQERGASWPLGRVLRRGQTELMEDVLARFGPLGEAGPTDPPRRALVVPIGSGGAPAGALVAGVSPHLPLDDEYRGFFDLVARQLATAIRHAYAAEGERVHAERLRALASASVAIGGSLSLDETLRLITDEARAIVGAHQAVTSLSIDRSWTQALNTVSLSDKYATWRAYQEQPDGSGIYSLVCRLNLPMRLTQAELEAHPAWRGFGAAADRHPPMRGWLAAPLTDREGQNIGLIQLSDRYVGEFTEEDEAMLVQLARMASVAIENARLYHETQEAVRIRDEFLSFVSHDLRTPLTSIKGFAQLLRRQAAARGDLPDPAWLDEGLGRIDATTSRMAAMIDELLDVARLQAGRPIELRLRPVDLGQLARQAAGEAQQTTDVHRIEVDAPEHGPVGRWDRVRIERVLANLLSNAIKYSPQGGRIVVRVGGEGEAGDGWAVVSVQDYGVGIPSADLERIFERFQRAGNVSGRIGGSGLGLAGSRQLVELHGGSIVVESDEGHGSTFTVRLPLGDVEAE